MHDREHGEEDGNGFKIRKTKAEGEDTKKNGILAPIRFLACVSESSKQEQSVPCNLVSACHNEMYVVLQHDFTRRYTLKSSPGTAPSWMEQDFVAFLVAACRSEIIHTVSCKL